MLHIPRSLNTLFEVLGVNQDNIGSVPTKRTLWSIVYTCFATTLACTWVAMHPNIPRNSRSRTSIFMRIALALCALIVPEVIAFWAVVQWRAAKEYTNYFKSGTSRLDLHGSYL
ncbi:hypothetical protein BJ165DRAFT_1516433 [Panaeolus papilionaceus]|nr:hypothetical protein BJ165DRAFT_1516433 [Panaeolus papilionaceus]